MKILVSFSLYGTDQKFLHGAIRNSEIINGLGADWASLFYIGNDVPKPVLSILKSHGAIIVEQQSDWHPNGMFWRFNAAREFDFDYLLVRDVDSRITPREIEFVKTWIESSKIIHVIRDHPHHKAVIMGGLWGVTSQIKSIGINWNAMSNYGNDRGSDQNFLRDEVWLMVKHSSREFGSAFITSLARPWKSKRDPNGGFIGEAFDEFEDFDPVLREIHAGKESLFFRVVLRSVQLAFYKLRILSSKN